MKNHSSANHSNCSSISYKKIRKTKSLIIIKASQICFFIIFLNVFFISESFSVSHDTSIIKLSGVDFYRNNEPLNLSSELPGHLMYTLSGLSSQEMEAFHQKEVPFAIVGVKRDLNFKRGFDQYMIREKIRDEDREVGGGILQEFNLRNDINYFIWTTYVASTNADGLRVFFESTKFPADATIFIYSEEQFFGPYGNNNFQETNNFISHTVFGEHCYIEVRFTDNCINEGLNLYIDAVGHMDFGLLRNDPNDPDQCFEDVNCVPATLYDGIEELKQATAAYNWFLSDFDPEYDLWFGMCSGALIRDNRDNDLQPFFLTAHHCKADGGINENNSHNLEFFFDYHTIDCWTGENDITSVLGANLLETGWSTDFSLFLLHENPSQPRTYLDWTITQPNSGDFLHGTHHPGDDFLLGLGLMRYSKLFKNTPYVYNPIRPPSNYLYSKIIHGQRAKGSSGGPVVNENNQIVGQHYGYWSIGFNPDECDPNANFWNLAGRFDKTYEHISHWIDGNKQVNMSITTANVNFGNIEVGWLNIDQSIIITNNSNLLLYIDDATISGSDSDQFNFLTYLPLQIPPGQERMIMLSFVPTSSGFKSAELNLYHNADNLGSPLQISLSGNGIGDPDPSSIAVTAHVSPNYVPPHTAVTVFGSAIYDTGFPVTNGTVTISAGNDSWTTTLNALGMYERVIPAPESSGNINVFVDDGTTTGSNQVYINIIGGGDGEVYTYDESLTSKDIDDGPIDITKWFMSDDDHMVAWTMLTDVYDAVTVRQRFYDHNGNRYSSRSTSFPHPNDHGYTFWELAQTYNRQWIDGETLSTLSGRHTVDVRARPAGGSWQHHETIWWVLSYDFKESIMCKDVQSSDPWNPINPTNTFYQNDNRAITWSRYTDQTEEIELKTDWYEPNGSLYSSSTYTLSGPPAGQYFAERKQWSWINIDGANAANKCGDWVVKKYSKNPFNEWDLIYTDHFKIKEHPNINPEINISLSNPNPIEGEEVNVEITGTDNTYIDNVVLFWNDGNQHFFSWDDIIASGFNASHNIGSFYYGQSVLVYAVIKDTSGNQSTTPVKTINIASGASISVVPSSLDFGSVDVGECEILDYHLIGEGLNSDIIISAPQGFEVSTQLNTPFQGSIVIPQSNGIINQTIYVQFCPSFPDEYIGQINHVSGDVSKNLMVSGLGDQLTHEVILTADPAWGGFVNGAGTYPEGFEVFVAATPEQNFEFVHWIEDGNIVSEDAQYSFFITESRNLTAIFQNENDIITFVYTDGDIPTDYGNPWQGPSSCPGVLEVTIPEGYVIAGLDVSYTMTAANGANMSEQRSRLYSPTTGTGEENSSQGSGNTGGTYSYERTGLTFANGAGGTLVFHMDAGRTWGNSSPNTGCNTYYNKVDNNSWVLTIYLEPTCTVSCAYNHYSCCIEDPPFNLSTSYLCGPHGDYTGQYSGTGVYYSEPYYYFDPNVGLGIYTITYCYTDSNDCTACTTFYMEVKPVPEVSCPDDFEVSIDTPPFLLTGGTPLGGEYVIIDGDYGQELYFDPAELGPGNHTIKYYYPFYIYLTLPVIPPPPPICTDYCEFTISVTEPGIEDELTLNLGTGFTWFSINVNPGSMDPNDLFADLSPCENDRIIGQTDFATFFNNSWVGSLTEINHNQSYVMELCSQQSATIIGSPAPISPMSLNAGFTWLGYLPQSTLPINTALANINPSPGENDRLVGQTIFATYFNNQWVGSLSHLTPGNGYVIDLSNAVNLEYPDATAKQGDAAGQMQKPLISPTGKYPAQNMQHNMTMIAQMITKDDRQSFNQNDVVYAYVGDECRGIANVTDINGTLFLTIGSNLQAAETVNFRVWLDEANELFEIRESVSFEAFRALGTMDNPFILTMDAPLGEDFAGHENWHIGDPFPNPFTGSTQIPYYVGGNSEVSLNVYNSIGQLVFSFIDTHEQAGNHQLTFEQGGLLPGVFHFRMEISARENSMMKTGRVIVM